MGKYYIKSYGCQMNDQDSLQVGQILKNKGFSPSLDPWEADLVLVNTCSIREKAAHKLYSDIGRFRKVKAKKPDLKIGVLGCQAQADGKDLLKRFPEVDLMLGPDQIQEISNYVDQSFEERFINTKFEARDDFEFINLIPDERPCAQKANVSIMKGCDNFCSFCIVPFVRGREVSRSSAEIIAEVKSLVDQGVKEVTLLGQNVNSYGNKTPDELSFAQLLEEIARVTDLKRLRFTTSHPKDTSAELIEQFRNNPILMPQMHLPLQSGSDEVLKRMYRGYTTAEYLKKVDALKQVCPEIALSTDIIVGFPGESRADFEATLELMRQVQYDSVYAFVYSPRPKTTAAKYFEDPLPLEEKNARLQELFVQQREITWSGHKKRVNEIEEVLVESFSESSHSYQGRTRQSRIVHIESEQDILGQIIATQILSAGPHSLKAVY